MTWLIGILGALLVWVCGFISGARRASQRAAKRQETPVPDYDPGNPLNSAGDSWVSEYGTEWHMMRPLR